MNILRGLISGCVVCLTTVEILSAYILRCVGLIVLLVCLYQTLVNITLSSAATCLFIVFMSTLFWTELILQYFTGLLKNLFLVGVCFVIDFNFIVVCGIVGSDAIYTFNLRCASMLSWLGPKFIRVALCDTVPVVKTLINWCHTAAARGTYNLPPAAHLASLQAAATAMVNSSFRHPLVAEFLATYSADPVRFHLVFGIIRTAFLHFPEGPCLRARSC